MTSSLWLDSVDAEVGDRPRLRLDRLSIVGRMVIVPPHNR